MQVPTVCGIAGFLNFSTKPERGDLRTMVGRMIEPLYRRGPDNQGVWIDNSSKVAFGHRRLSILDLSPTGLQPMSSGSGRFTITYNGEVYNFAALREELGSAGHRFHGYSDTEVVLHAIEEWGIEASVKRFVGMFAFAVWDHHEQCLHLVRDRLGDQATVFRLDGRFLHVWLCSQITPHASSFGAERSIEMC